MKDNKREISIVRSSAAEYLTFITATGESDVNAVYFDENVWLTQKMMGVLYNVGTNTINYHLKKIFTDREVDENSVIRKFRITAADGKTYNTNHYNLSAIIAVGNKVDSPRAIQFRKWAIHGETAAETIYRRADSEKENMALTTWKDAPDGKIQRFDVVIAKNYLTKDELASMSRIVNAYLDLAELRAEEEVPMTMEDWAEQFEGILRLSKKEILTNAGSISAKIAEEHALTEFEKYRVKQDKLYQSDFDKILIGEVDGNEVDYIDDNVNNNEEL
jgi:hypothetical protein|uniref:RhuM family protein n=1 Tax=Lachnospira sp. TaxID=2049031 RepID=UPI003FEEE72D